MLSIDRISNIDCSLNIDRNMSTTYILRSLMRFYIMFDTYTFVFNDNSSFYYNFRSQTYINLSQLIILLIYLILIFRPNIDRNMSITHILRSFKCLYIVFGVNTYVFNNDSSFLLWFMISNICKFIIIDHVLDWPNIDFSIKYWSNYVNYTYSTITYVFLYHIWNKYICFQW